MSYYLLTGATGLLGGYLMRDLTLADVPLAVVVRPARWESAAQRIETIMARWERELGHALARPVVLEGEIAEPGLGMSAADTAWVFANVDTIVHSAAALTFIAESPEGEPWRSNIQGTRNVLALCRQANIRACHYVSTAYVCGLRQGRILESELDVGQTLGNDYEKSKLIAEQEVLSSGSFDSITVYRPSIIVGDSRTGYTSSYHGFYTPLRLIHSLAQAFPWDVIAQSDWLGRLHLEGGEHKNFVPVDWISSVMTWLITHPQCHGTTYHLTNPEPATVLLMREAMTEILVEMVRHDPARAGTVAQNEDLVAGFREQMLVYQSYWRDDPQFDSTRTQAAAPHLPCPVIDREVMHRLVRFAIEANFGWPREASPVPPYDLGRALATWLAAAVPQPGNDHAAAQRINLQVSGPGGGQWSLELDDDGLAAAERGVQSSAATTCYLTSTTLTEIAQGNLSLEDSIHTGRLVVTGDSIRPLELARVFRELAPSGEASALST